MYGDPTDLCTVFFVRIWDRNGAAGDEPSDAPLVNVRF
jgi:hypothetical protein